METMELRESEEYLIQILRHFDFLRRHHYDIQQLCIYGREPYIVFGSRHAKLYMDLGMTNVEFRKGNILMEKKIDISEYAKKQHGIWLDSISVIERIKNYSEFIKKYFDELSR